MPSYLNDGPQTRVNGFQLTDQLGDAIATLSDGSYVITWQSNSQDGSKEGVYLQHFDAQGHRIGVETRVNTTIADSQITPKIAGLADGGYVVTWVSMNQDGDGGGIYMQRYDAHGAKMGVETLVNVGGTQYSQTEPVITATADGGFYIDYQAPFNGTADTDVLARYYDSAGNGTTNVLAGNTAAETDGTGLGLSNGNIVGAWVVNGGISMRIFTTTNGFVVPPVVVHTPTAGHIDVRPVLASLADGGFVLSWTGTGIDDDSYGVEAQRYDASGTPRGAPFLVNSVTEGSQELSSVAGLSDGGYVIVWASEIPNSVDHDIYGQVFDAAGNKTGGEFLVSTTGTGDHFEQAVSALAYGGFVVTWSSTTEDAGGVGVFQRVYSAATSLDGPQLVYGTDGADRIDGGPGADTMNGLTGDDTYVIDNAADHPIEAVGQGTDTVESAINWDLAPLVNGVVVDSNIENLVLTGLAVTVGHGSAADNILLGSAALNDLYGLGGDDYIDAGAGNDYVEGGDGQDTIYGGIGNDQISGQNDGDGLFGGDGNDVIDGGDGNDYAEGNGGNDNLTGGQGDDYLDGGAGNDVLQSGGGNDYAYGGDGNDTFIAGVGNSQYYGGAGDDSFDASGVGWAVSVNLTNRTAYFNGNAILLDSIENVTGTVLADTLAGSAADNRLDGGLGIDKMYGFAGNDTYVVDTAGDLASELTAGNTDAGGDDTVYSGINYVLPAYIENLFLTGLAVSGTGNALGNMMTGDSLANALNGLAGADIMAGGDGNDVYVVDNVNDQVIETASPTGGIDTVKASVSYVLSDNVENLILTGAVGLTGTGNALSNSMTGGDGGDSLYGGLGNDRLDGGAVVSADHLFGGAGNDIYVVDSTSDVVTESSAADGIDTVQSSVAWTLNAFVENLTLTGAAVIDGTGNELNNAITGNGAINRITGGAGNDTLTGGAGNDIFVFGSTTTNGVDHLKDFVSGGDHLSFTGADYGFAAGHSLSASQLSLTGAAVGSGAQFVYNATTHVLFWDANGSTAGGLTALIYFDAPSTAPATGDFIFT